MTVVRLFALLLMLVVVAGCGSTDEAEQVHPNRVGDVGLNERYEAEYAAQRAARNHYDFYAPKATATIRSTPAGALVEWYNQDSIWVAVGNTPARDIVIEATGKPELFRVSLPGFLPLTRWVATTPNGGDVDVEFVLIPETPADRLILND